MLVVDTSVLIDAMIPVKGREDRTEAAQSVISVAEEKGIPLLMPRLGIVETISLVMRLSGKEEALELVIEYLDSRVLQVSEDWIFEDAKEIAKKIHPRAADSYFIATAKKFNALLVSSDRDMVSRARKLNIPAFYVLDDSDRTQLLENLGGVV